MCASPIPDLAPPTGDPTDGRSARFVRPIIWSAGSDLGAKVAFLATTFIALRSLTPVQFAVFLGLSATALLASGLWECGYVGILTREFAAGRIAGWDGVGQVSRARLRLLPIWLLAFSAGLLALSHGVQLPLVPVICMAAGSLAFAAHTVFLNLLRAGLGFAQAGSANAIGKTIAALASLGALPRLRLGDPLIVLSGAFLIGELATLSISVAFLLSGRIGRVFRRPLDGGTVLRLKQALPFAANSALALVYNRFDVLILAALASVAQLSLYAPASRIQDALYLIPSAIGVVAFPIISKASTGTQDGRRRAARLIRQLAILGTAVSFPVAVLVFVFAPLIIRVGLGADYEGSVPALRILIWFLPLAAIQAPLLAGLMGVGRAADTTKVFSATFLTAILMHILLDRPFGAVGAATASLLRDVVAVPVVVLFAYRANLLVHHRLGPTAVAKDNESEALGSVRARPKAVSIWSGYASHHVARVRALREAGYDVIAFSYSTGEENYPGFLTPPEPHRFINDVPLERVKNSLSFYRTLRLLQEEAPDVVLTCGWERPESLAGVLFSKLSKDRRCLLMMDNQIDDRPRNALVELIKRMYLRMFDGVLTAGQRQVEYLRRLGVSPQLIRSGYDCVDNEYIRRTVDAIRRSDSVRPVEGDYFLTVARLTTKKNLATLIAAYAGYRNALSNEHPWKLVICGGGPLENGLRQLVRELDLSKYIVMPGRIDEFECLLRYYAYARVFILPSSHSEQWGLVVNEAMAAALPVMVSTRAGCSADLVENGSNGFTFDPMSVDDLRDLLTWSHGSGRRLTAMGNHSSRLIDEFSVQRFAESVISLHVASLSRRRPDRSDKGS